MLPCQTCVAFEITGIPRFTLLMWRQKPGKWRLLSSTKSMVNRKSRKLKPRKSRNACTYFFLQKISELKREIIYLNIFKLFE